MISKYIIFKYSVSLTFVFTLLFSFKSLTKGKNTKKVPSDIVIEQCHNSLEWYNDHPGYRGEFTRVLDYCKKNAKDISPEGFKVNPILSDFGSFSGVNTRPRDRVHQGIDIIGSHNQPIIAIKDGIVLEKTIEDCWGATLVVDHGNALDGKKIIAVYGHVGDFMVNENDIVKRGDIIAKLPQKANFLCMARVRHLHLQIGQEYCKKEEKNNWGCKYFIKDFYNSLNPHAYWSNGPNNVTCFEKDKKYKEGTITYPFICKKNN